IAETGALKLEVVVWPFMTEPVSLALLHPSRVGTGAHSWLADGLLTRDWLSWSSSLSGLGGWRGDFLPLSRLIDGWDGWRRSWSHHGDVRWAASLLNDVLR